MYSSSGKSETKGTGHGHLERESAVNSVWVTEGEGADG